MDCVNAAGFLYRPKDTTSGHGNNIILYEPAKQGLLALTPCLHSWLYTSKPERPVSVNGRRPIMSNIKMPTTPLLF